MMSKLRVIAGFLVVFGLMGPAWAQSVKGLKGECRTGYNSWKKLGGYGAFAASKRGFCGWSWDNESIDKAQNSAVSACRSKKGAGTCLVIATNKTPSAYIADWNGCNVDGKEPVADRLASCGRIIESKRSKAADRSYAYNERGRIRQASDETELAIADYTASLEESKTNAAAYINRARMRAAKRDFDGAIADAENAVKHAARDRGDISSEAKELIAKWEDQRNQLAVIAAMADDKLCAQALRSTREGWDTAPALEDTVAEARRRALTIDGCRTAIGLPAVAVAAPPPALISPSTDKSGPKAELTVLAQPPEVRIALVIGNANYRAASRLDNPSNDANLMADTLSKAGFQVTKLIDANQDAMKRAFVDFAREARSGAATSLFYYAGHGVQVQGENYLIPVDATIQHETEVPFQAVSVNEFLGSMDETPSKVKIVVLDACRDNPFATLTRSGSRGLATVIAPAGTYIAYSTAPGMVAKDGEAKNSPYTAALARFMLDRGSRIEETFKKTRAEVLRATANKQQPWESSSLTGDFYFVPGAQ